MATVVIMPRQGQSVESCIITVFNKKVGDTVEKGETLCAEIEVHDDKTYSLLWVE